MFKYSGLVVIERLKQDTKIQGKKDGKDHELIQRKHNKNKTEIT